MPVAFAEYIFLHCMGIKIDVGNKLMIDAKTTPFICQIWPRKMAMGMYNIAIIIVIKS